jgi:hypothetical protein
MITRVARLGTFSIMLEGYRAWWRWKITAECEDGWRTHRGASLIAKDADWAISSLIDWLLGEGNRWGGINLLGERGKLGVPDWLGREAWFGEETLVELISEDLIGVF